MKRLPPLYTNSFYLLVSNGIATASGFLFWILVARMYSTAHIGLATSLSSLIGLITSLSLLGLNTGLLRFLPTSSQKQEKINSSLIIVGSISVVLALYFLNSLPQPLRFVREQPIYASIFIGIALITTLNVLTDSILIAYRAAFQVLIKSVLYNSTKLILPFALVSYGAFGIFGALSVGTVASLLYVLVLLWHRFSHQYAARVNTMAVKKIASVSFFTYISGLITSIPSYILPLFITTYLSPVQTAYYYVAATTANVLFTIPLVITQNLLVEGSYDESKTTEHTKKAGLLIAILLIPAIAMLMVFGNYVLLVFGTEYSQEGLSLLRLLSIAGIPAGANYLFGTLLTIYKKMRLLIIINSIGCGVLVGGSYLLLAHGIAGIGYATIGTQTLMLLLYLISFSFVNGGGYGTTSGSTSKTS